MDNAWILHILPEPELLYELCYWEMHELQNEPTNYRIMDLSNNSSDYEKLACPNPIYPLLF